MELNVRKCLKCGAYNYEINPCKCEGCGIKCCNENMQLLEANSSDGAAEKHVPTYEIIGDKIIAKVNHVMDEDHFIEWIACTYENDISFHYLKPGEEATTEFKYEKGAVLYAYCNKHNLWKKEID